MPKANLQFRERSVRRAVRAATKEGLVVSGVEITVDGAICIHVAPPFDPLPLDPPSSLSEEAAR